MEKKLVIDETWQMIEFAISQNCKVTQKDGHKVDIVKSHFGDEIKVYCSFPMYYMSTIGTEKPFLFDGLNYEEWNASYVHDFTIDSRNS